MRRVLVVHISPEAPSFVRKDIDILSSHFDVEEFFYSGRRDVPRMTRRVFSNDLTYSWFAWDNAAWAVRLSRFLGKRSVVVAGGFDVADVPEIDYGNLLNHSRARRTRYALNHANLVLAVSKSTYGEAVRCCGRRNIEIVYHGFDSRRFLPQGEKERVVLSVGDVNVSSMRRKGIATFVDAANFLPSVPFLLVGRVHEDVREILEEKKPENLRIVGRVPDSELLDSMQRSKVYVQVSAHEGFGCSIAEAMLCECVPVVTRRGAIPEVVGSCGHFVPYDSPRSTAKAIGKALDDLEKGKQARQRIKKEFPLVKREESIVRLVSRLIG